MVTVELAFLLAALGIGSFGRVAPLPAGLFFLALSLLWPHLVVVLR